MKKRYLIKDICRSIWGWLWFIPMGHYIMYIPWYDAIVGGFITTLLFMPIYSEFEIIWSKHIKKRLEKWQQQ